MYTRHDTLSKPPHANPVKERAHYMRCFSHTVTYAEILKFIDTSKIEHLILN